MAEDIEVEIQEDGTVKVVLPGADNDDSPQATVDHYANLAEKLTVEELEDIATEVIEAFQSDEETREPWVDMLERGMDLLGLKLEERSEPFEGACGATSPLIMESAVKFQSKCILEIFPPEGPCRTQIIGKKDEAVMSQAERIKDFINWECTELIHELYEELEKLLLHLAVEGTCLLKLYYSEMLKRPTVNLVTPDDFFVSNNVSDLRQAERFTHRIYRSPVMFHKEVEAGMYLDIDLGEPEKQERGRLTTKLNEAIGFEQPADYKAPEYIFLEQHVYMSLPKKVGDDEEELPYIITVDYDSQTVLSIRRGWRKEDESKTRMPFFIDFHFVRGFGWYSLGYIHLLGNLTMTATAAMRSLVDSGQFATLQGGFKLRGLRIAGDEKPHKPGEFRDVEGVTKIDDAIMNLPFREPSATLYQMLEYVTGAGQKFADSTEQVIADSTNYGPVGTTMALLEASTKFFTAIHKRIHRSLGDFLQVLAQINYDWLPDTFYYDVFEQQLQISRDDFDGRVDVIPVSDPNVPSSAHRVAMAQLLLQLAGQSPPGMYDLRAIHRKLLIAANVQDIETVMPPQPEPKNQDPLSDINSAVMGTPIKAFPGQDHDAHIGFKTAWLQDPLNGANPIMQGASQLVMANVKEHMVMRYGEQVQGLAQLQQGQGKQIAVEAAKQILQANQNSVNGPGDIEQATLMLEQQALELKQEEFKFNSLKDTLELMLKQQKQQADEKAQEVKTATDVAQMAADQSNAGKDRQVALIKEFLDLLAKTAEHVNRLEVAHVDGQHKIEAVKQRPKPAPKYASGGLVNAQNNKRVYPSENEYGKDALQDYLKKHPLRDDKSELDSIELQAREEYQKQKDKNGPNLLDPEYEKGFAEGGAIDIAALTPTPQVQRGELGLANGMPQTTGDPAQEWEGVDNKGPYQPNTQEPLDIDGQSLIDALSVKWSGDKANLITGMNNPMGLKFTKKDSWYGSMPYENGKFVKFETPFWGLRAGTKNIMNYGERSIDSFVDKYAPARENSKVKREKYKTAIMNATGSKSTSEKLDFGDPDVLRSVVPVVVQTEGGENPFSDKHIDLAINMAKRTLKDE